MFSYPSVYSPSLLPTVSAVGLLSPLWRGKTRCAAETASNSGETAVEDAGDRSAEPVHSDEIALRMATEDDDPSIRRILQEQPSGGTIQIGFHREPSAWNAAKIEGDRHSTVIGVEKANGRLIGMFSRSVRRVYVNGQEARLGYLSQLRVRQGYRLRVRKLAEGWNLLNDSHREDEMPFDFASVLADNRAARRYLEKGFPGFPTCREFETIATLLLPTRQLRIHRPPVDLTLDFGSEHVLDEIIACLARNGKRHQFAPVWTREDLCSEERCPHLHPSDFITARRNGRLMGCLAIWDQRLSRQMVIHDYSRWVARLRPCINLVAPVLGVFRLPPAGQELPYAFLSHVAVDNDDPQVLSALVGAAVRLGRRRKIGVLLLGLASRNPMLPWLRKSFRTREMTSVIYLADPGFDGSSSGQFACDQLDGRIPHLEIAVL